MPLTSEITAQAVKFSEQCYNIGVFAERERILGLLIKERLESIHPTAFSYRKELDRIIQMIGQAND